MMKVLEPGWNFAFTPPKVSLLISLKSLPRISTGSPGLTQAGPAISKIGTDLAGERL